MALNYTNPGWTNGQAPYINAANLNAISDNLQEVCEVLGNTSMGATATTVTGAVKEIVDEIGNTAMGTTATTITGAIKEVHDSVASAETPYSSTVSIKIGTGSYYTGTIVKYGKLRVYNFYYEANSPVGTISLATKLGTVDPADKPRNEETAAIIGIKGNSSAYNTIYPMAVMIDNQGRIYLRGLVSEIAQCSIFRGQIVWVVN